MSSAIERELYGRRGTHGLLSISLGKGRVVVTVAPWSHPNEVTEAIFEAAELRHVWAAPDTTKEEIELPWDIIGFDSTEEIQGRWVFVINCSVIEFCWSSTWPFLSKHFANGG